MKLYLLILFLVIMTGCTGIVVSMLLNMHSTAALIGAAIWVVFYAPIVYKCCLKIGNEIEK